VTAGNDGAAAADEHQRRGANHFCEVFLQMGYLLFLIRNKRPYGFTLLLEITDVKKSCKIYQSVFSLVVHKYSGGKKSTGKWLNAQHRGSILPLRWLNIYRIDGVQ
jgi:hypothetical protein